jgi:uncharacterized membrane protein YdbT with pleckstrin-like domain
MKFLIEGEQIIKRFSNSRLIYFKIYLIALVFFSIPVLYLYFELNLPAWELYIITIPVSVGIILIIINEIRVKLGTYYITNYRIASVRGLFRKTINSCNYDKIVNVKVDQKFIQRIFNIGTLDITTFQRTEILFDSVGNPGKIERMIYSQMEKQKSGAENVPKPAQKKQPELAKQDQTQPPENQPEVRQ